MKVLPSNFNTYSVKNRATIFSGKFVYPTIKLNKLTIVALLLAGIFFSLLIAKLGFFAGITILLVVVGLPLIYSVVVYPEFGIMVLLIAAYLVMWVIRMAIVDFPLGTLMDAFQALLILGFFIKQKNNRDWSFMKTPTSKIILVWIFFNILEVLNPWATSMLSWLYTIRSVAAVTLMYFVFVYQIKSVRFIRQIIKVWIALSFFSALYGFKQEYLGFFDFEKVQLNDPLMISLLFINGVWRKFSIFSDPVAFSYNMVISSVLCICLMTAKIKTWKKAALLLLTICFLLNMLYSGTRGAYVLVPAAMLMLAILNYSPKVLKISIVAAFVLAVVIVIPTSNQTIYRFQSAFKPSKDISYSVRAKNQKRIKPFILSHPMGGGLGATGGWGQRFSPNSFLANFPPDSGYVRVAVEMGWIGLFLICALMFTIMYSGVKNYFLIKNPELKCYCMAATVIVFVLNVGNFPQEAIVQFPTNILFMLVAALITVTHRLDQTPETDNNYAANL